MSLIDRYYYFFTNKTFGITMNIKSIKEVVDKKNLEIRIDSTTVRVEDIASQVVSVLSNIDYNGSEYLYDFFENICVTKEPLPTIDNSYRVCVTVDVATLSLNISIVDLPNNYTIHIASLTTHDEGVFFLSLTALSLSIHEGTFNK